MSKVKNTTRFVRKFICILCKEIFNKDVTITELAKKNKYEYCDKCKEEYKEEIKKNSEKIKRKVQCHNCHKFYEVKLNRDDIRFRLNERRFCSIRCKLDYYKERRKYGKNS